MGSMLSELLGEAIGMPQGFPGLPLGIPAGFMVIIQAEDDPLSGAHERGQGNIF